MLPTTESTTRSLRDYLFVLRRRKGTIILCTFVVVLAALTLTFLENPIYQASAKVLVQANPAGAVVSGSGGGVQAETRAPQNEIDFIQSDAMRAAVREELGFAARIGVNVPRDSSVFDFRARNEDAERAALIANTYAQKYIELRLQRAVDNYLATQEVIQRKIDEIIAEKAVVQDQLNQQVAPIQAELNALDLDDPGREPLQLQIDGLVNQFEPQLTSLQSRITGLQNEQSTLELASDLLREGDAEIIRVASVPSSPVSPDPPRNTVIAFVVGLVLGIGLALLFEYLDDTVKTKDDLDRVAPGITNLALIPRVTGWKDRTTTRVVSLSEPTSPAAEAYRSLRTSIQFLSLDRPIRTLMVTSPRPGEGKTTTLVNLAVALALAGQRVVILSCDLRKPRIHEFFDLPNHAGFTSVLLGDVPLSSAIHRVPGEDRIAVLTSGPIPPNPSELLSSQRAADVVTAVQAEADIVLIDAPPVLPVTDALILSAIVDAVILVADSGSTVKKEAHRTVEMLRQVGAPIVGTVLNGVSSASGYGYGYGYGYGFGYGTDGESQERPPRRSRRGARKAERASVTQADGNGDGDGTAGRKSRGAARTGS